MDAIQTGQAPGNVTEDMTTKLQAAGITVTASSNTVSIAADTTVTISGDITFELNKQTYTLSAGGYDTGYPELK
ncbi:unknown [Clostridium sp. CAG:273]|nr:unknown [Clostridium sp. CAG:273]